MTFLPLQGAGGYGPGGEIILAGGLFVLIVSWGLAALVLVLIKEIGNVDIKQIGKKSLIFSIVMLFLVLIISNF